MNNEIPIKNPAYRIETCHGALALDERVYVMGIVNVTPDSFSDGGRYFAPDKAVEHGLRLLEEGADILDIGGESTRPGSEEVSIEEELRRVIPVVKALREKTSLPISIDTRKAAVAEASLEAGADIINDISALRFDPAMADVASRRAVPVILMHMLGEPKTMQQDPHYGDVIAEVQAFFLERIACCRNRGIASLILDPGIGFGKRLEDNLLLIKQLDAFLPLGYPLAVGVSRKSFIGRITGREAEERRAGSLAAALAAVQRGAAILRVHDVAETVDALNVYASISGAGGRG